MLTHDVKGIQELMVLIVSEREMKLYLIKGLIDSNTSCESNDNVDPESHNKLAGK